MACTNPNLDLSPQKDKDMVDHLHRNRPTTTEVQVVVGNCFLFEILHLFVQTLNQGFNIYIRCSWALSGAFLIKQTSTVSKSRVPNFETFPYFSGTLQCVVSMEILLFRVFLTRLMLMYYIFCMLRHLYTYIYTHWLMYTLKNNTSIYPAVVWESSCIRPCSNLAFFFSLLWVSWHGVGGMDSIPPEKHLRRQILDQLKLRIGMFGWFFWGVSSFVDMRAKTTQLWRINVLTSPIIGKTQ